MKELEKKIKTKSEDITEKFRGVAGKFMQVTAESTGTNREQIVSQVLGKEEMSMLAMELIDQDVGEKERKISSLVTSDLLLPVKVLCSHKNTWLEFLLTSCSGTKATIVFSLNLVKIAHFQIINSSVPLLKIPSSCFCCCLISPLIFTLSTRPTQNFTHSWSTLMLSDPLIYSSTLYVFYFD